MEFSSTTSEQNALSKALTSRLGILPDAAMALCNSARLTKIARGNNLLRAGENWQHLFWVEHGGLRLFYLDCNGIESNKNFFLDHSLLWPITPTLRDKPVGFFVDAFEDSIVWTLPILPLLEALAGVETWNKMQREQAFLQASARQRYESLLKEQPAWAARIPLKHLASYLGVTDVSLSRLRAEMGLIKG
jgi:hypothetical protein